jgi:predicted amidohydrolase YtcJ
VVLFTGAKVFTGTEGAPFASAFLVEGDRFTWVGDVQTRIGGLPMIAAGHPVIDLAGATVLPGLLDIHTHPALMAELVDAVSVLPPTVRSVAGLVEALRSAPAWAEGSDTWIRGFGFDDAAYPEGRWPNRHDLDLVSRTQPVFVQRCDGHSAVCNSVALARAGITRDTPDPPGAAYGRDADGVPDGRLIEPGAWAPVAACFPPVDADVRIERIARLGHHFAGRGLVAVEDLAATFTVDPLESFRSAAERAWIPRTGLFLLWDHISADPPSLGDEDRRGRAWIAGVKLLLDGAYSNATAWCHDAYPGTGEHGIRTATDASLREAGSWARSNRVQLAVHAMGDAAIDAVLDAFADEPSWLADRPAVRIEHATLLSPERIARIRDARMRFAVVSHSIFFFAEYGAYVTHLSAQQFRDAYPIRSCAEQLRDVALSSDSPATAWADADHVFTSIQAAVTRRAWNGAPFGPDQAVDVAQALTMYTSRAAACAGLHDLGVIETGRDASFVVLDRDVFSIPVEEIGSVQIASTWASGRQVFARSMSPE